MLLVTIQKHFSKWSDNGGDNQRWELVSPPPIDPALKSELYFTLKNKKFPNRCLSVYKGEFRNGNKVILEDYNGSEHQLWKLQMHSDTSCSLVNKRNQSFRLDNTGKHKNRGHMGIYAINDHRNVRFIIDFLERNRDNNDIIKLRMASKSKYVLDASLSVSNAVTQWENNSKDNQKWEMVLVSPLDSSFHDARRRGLTVAQIAALQNIDANTRLAVAMALNT